MADILIVVGLMVVIAAVIIAGSVFRAASVAPRKKKLAKLQALINELENHCLDQIEVEPNDLTAHRVASIIRQSRQKELS